MCTSLSVTAGVTAAAVLPPPPPPAPACVSRQLKDMDILGLPVFIFLIWGIFWLPVLPVFTGNLAWWRCERSNDLQAMCVARRHKCAPPHPPRPRTIKPSCAGNPKFHLFAGSLSSCTSSACVRCEWGRRACIGAPGPCTFSTTARGLVSLGGCALGVASSWDHCCFF